jgi:uncharacterized membrane protein YhaH (DUF805 family)
MTLLLISMSSRYRLGRLAYGLVLMINALLWAALGRYALDAAGGFDELTSKILILSFMPDLDLGQLMPTDGAIGHLSMVCNALVTLTLWSVGPATIMRLRDSGWRSSWALIVAVPCPLIWISLHRGLHMFNLAIAGAGALFVVACLALVLSLESTAFNNQHACIRAATQRI